MSAVGQRLGDTSLAGTWRLIAKPERRSSVPLTTLRDFPLLPDSFSFADPFGPKDLTLALPQVSIYDRLGHGDLSWLQKKASLSLIWNGDLPALYPFGVRRGALRNDFRWEGYINSYSIEDGTLQLSCKGSMYQLDDYLAKPEYLRRPLPYEHAIQRQFHDKPHLRLNPLHVEWPGWWGHDYEPPPRDTPNYLVPIGVHKGDHWTGLLTRSTGSWDPVLTSYISTLLNAMYTRNGRWTIDLHPGRLPVLQHVSMDPTAQSSAVVLDVVSDAISVDGLEVDWSQSIDVIYGQGQSLAGVAFSGMQISSDGHRTTYVPLAATRQAYPPTKHNPWRNLSEMPRESPLQVLQGMDQYEAEKVARAHLERFGDPGVTGSVTISGDVPFVGGGRIPHSLCRAGMQVVLKNLLGNPDGVVAHVTESTTSLTQGNTKLTFDSKFRDAQTVEEVRLRGRDSMSISRMLIGGQYAPPLPDMLLPWDYKHGSGMIPYDKKTIELFNEMPDRIEFPWEEWTKKHPPNKHFHDAYIKIGPASADASKNWAGRALFLAPKKGGKYAIPVKVSQSGSIRLLQIAAYDKHGNVMKVPFHVSFYYHDTTDITAMPKIPPYRTDRDSANYYPYHHFPFQEKQRYPFVKNAWETYNTDGTTKSTDTPQAVASAGLLPNWVWGTDKVKAGYFPRDGRTGQPTGLLVDETVKNFDTSTVKMFNPATPHGNVEHAVRNGLGFIYAMIYCDAQGSEPVYFLGRMFRSEPGSQGAAV